MTTQPDPDIRASSLHQRLTVALAAAGDRTRVAEALHSALTAQVQAPSPLLRWDDVRKAAADIAELRADDRAALEGRLDAEAARAAHSCETAGSHLDSLVTRRDLLLDGARWVAELPHEVAERRAAVEAAGRTLDEGRLELRGAQTTLDRVLEQRAAAAAAVEEADRELGEMAGVGGMDETGLRRELEAAGRAVVEAQRAHAAAVAAVRSLEAQQERAEDSSCPSATDAGDGQRSAPTAQLEAVLDAFEALRHASIGAGRDREAEAVADAWRDLLADLADVASAGHQRPGPSQLRAAEARLASASEALRQLAHAAAPTISDEERAEIDAAHAAVIAAEDRLNGRRVGASAARQRLEAARAAERALLDRHNFGGYLDVVLSGGRLGADDPTRAEIEREYLAAGAHLQALQAAFQGPPELLHLESERARLLAHAVELLGVDPEDRIIELLGAHPQVPHALVTDLRDALGAVDVRPVGTSLLTAAEAWLREQHAPSAAASEPARSPEAPEESSVDDLPERLAAARHAAADAAESLELAQRSVVALEAELTMRAGEDDRRLKRLAAAEQLRAQVDAVQATLTTAEDAARTTVSNAHEAHAAAEVALDRVVDELTELSHRVRALSDQLPIDLRIDGDPLEACDLLAARLRDHAEVIQPEIDAAEIAVSDAGSELEEALAALQLARVAAHGPQRVDFIEALAALLDGEGTDTVLVLDEPLTGIDGGGLDEMLELIRAGSSTRQVVLLTEDPAILGWAIELPADIGTAVPADALLARARPTHHDLTTDDPETSTTTSSRRWAGQR